MKQDGAERDRCRRFEREGLPDLLDGELAGSRGLGEAGTRWAELAAHLESCAECRADRGKYQRLARAIAQLGEGPAPAPIERVLTIADHVGAPPARQRLAMQVIGPLLAIAAIAGLLWLLQ
jgi:predicted anti-sigma-YlaC factor YlaD